MDTELGQKELNTKKIIMNRSIYELTLTRFEGEIKGIVRSNLSCDTCQINKY